MASSSKAKMPSWIGRRLSVSAVKTHESWGSSGGWSQSMSTTSLRPSAFRDFRRPAAIWPSSPPASQEIPGFACLLGFTGFAQDENASIDLVVRGSLLPPTLHAARTNPWVYRIIWDSHRSFRVALFQVNAPAYSTLVATPKMARRPTHPLMPPRLLPIRNRSPCRALTRCRYSRPRHRTRTMSPMAGSLSPRGTTVTWSPSLTLPVMECPRGRTMTVSPLESFSIAAPAQPTVVSDRAPPAAGSPRGADRVRGTEHTRVRTGRGLQR